MVKISSTLAKELIKRQNPHKYNAQRTTCLYGHDHDSKKEAMVCVKLTELAKEGKIFLLKRQPVFELMVNGMLVCRHRPDFQYYQWVILGHYCQEIGKEIGKEITNFNGLKLFIVEVKGFKTPDWVLKHKLFCALYPEIEYQIV